MGGRGERSTPVLSGGEGTQERGQGPAPIQYPRGHDRPVKVSPLGDLRPTLTDL